MQAHLAQIAPASGEGAARLDHAEETAVDDQSGGTPDERLAPRQHAFDLAELEAHAVDLHLVRFGGRRVRVRFGGRRVRVRVGGRRDTLILTWVRAGAGR